MSSNLQLDDHKLLYHLSVLNEWVKGKKVHPITVSIGPTRACNYKCIFCAYSFLEKKPLYLPLDQLSNTAKEMFKRGTKSFFFSGDGEPLLHKGLPDFISELFSIGIDTAINTNGFFLTRDISKIIIPKMKWMRISINGGLDEQYSHIHGTSRGSLQRVLTNVSNAVEIKKNQSLDCTIGVQSLILKENLDSLHLLASELKKIGADYFVLKPFLKHPQIKFNSSVSYRQKDVVDYFQNLESLSDSTFKVIIRWQSLEKIHSRSYKRCLSFPFFVDIDSEGNVYPCGPQMGNPQFCYGNIINQDWGEIWESTKKSNLENFLLNTFDCSDCMPNCRNDAVNRFLNKLKKPPAHINFI